ncbi:PepSY-associated TM helix domain-containing protein [Pelosinus sp. sgz500959]|uniref:PepSY-associated TM helix domain-containing protein n=1 Tax=Pelosinus sp. sgz500959 TaxID=3242472 RepID=UPI00366E05AD
MKYWYKIHKWASLVCAIFFLIMCMSALPLIFGREIKEFNQINVSAISEDSPIGGSNLSLDKLAEKSLKLYPGYNLRSVYLNHEKQSAGFSLKGEGKDYRYIQMDLHTAKIIEQSDDQGIKYEFISQFINFMYRMHVDMYLGSFGHNLLGFMCGLSIVALISGLWLYAPFMKNISFGTIRSGHRRIYWMDWHKLLGIVTLSWAVLLCLSGFIFVFSGPIQNTWQENTRTEFLVSYQGKPFPPQRILLDDVLNITQMAAPTRQITRIQLPQEEGNMPWHYVVQTAGEGFSTHFYHSVWIDAENGHITAMIEAPWYIELLSLARPIHFSNHDTLLLKILWFLIDALTCVMIITGIYAWFVKFRPLNKTMATKPTKVLCPVRQSTRQIWLLPATIIFLSLCGILGPLAGKEWNNISTVALGTPFILTLYYWWRS